MERILRKFIDLRYRLKPYLAKTMEQATETPQNDTSVDLQAEGLVVAEA